MTAPLPQDVGSTVTVTSGRSGCRRLEAGAPVQRVWGGVGAVTMPKVNRVSEGYKTPAKYEISLKDLRATTRKEVN